MIYNIWYKANVLLLWQVVNNEYVYLNLII